MAVAGATVATTAVLRAASASAQSIGNGQGKAKKITPADRKLAAKRQQTLQQTAGVLAAPAVMAPGTIPHYFGPYANYANSPLPTGPIASITVDAGGSGYTAPVVDITDAYGLGTGASATATVDPLTGAIIGFTNLIPGTGYSAPVVTITDPTGVDAAVTPVLGTLDASTGIRKFVDHVALLNAAGMNKLGHYIPVAIPDITTFPGCDYYEIELNQFTEKLHSDLPPTTLRGYRQTNTTDSTVSAFHYLGPLILASRDKPVRLKFTNKLPTGLGGNLFIPVDRTVMGAGMGPLDMPMMPGTKENYTQNRATVHLHGAFVPWISDGTPHQWTTPADEKTQYPKDVSVAYVPDMWFVNGAVQPNTVGVTTPPVAGATNNPGPGSLTFYYNNAQSARLMFYHDHAYGITRLNVYAGEVAGYLITDGVESDLINGTNNTGVNPKNLTVLPGLGVPLIVQDKTFVDATTISAQDPTWRWGTGPVIGTDPKTGEEYRSPNTGDMWVPSVYMPAQNPWDISGANAFGRWQYGPWFWPPTTDITNPPVPNEYYQPDPSLPNYAPWEPPMRPASPQPSMGMEAFNDTPLVNGTAYPYMDVAPQRYRFRILNGADDRFFNLHFYAADSTVTSSDGRTKTEVKMVPALKTAGFPAKWSTDGRAGGVPDPTTRGPAWIQIGTEGGFLPEPVVVPNQPINWNMNATAFNFGNVTDHSLLLGCAERADVIVDFTPYAGQTLILYNDAPAAFPALDPRYDYYTGDPSQMDTGGAPTTQPGFGPNTRTVMQFRVSGTAGTPPQDYYDPAFLATLKAVWAKIDPAYPGKRGVFEVSHEPIIVPQAAYNSAYGATFPGTVREQYVQLFDTNKTFTPIGGAAPITIAFKEKAAHDEMGAAYDTHYGRMGGMLGLELLNTTNLTQNIILYGYISPPVDIVTDCGAPGAPTANDGTQIWKITHNGVDTHPIHVHLFNAQLINRVAWDGALLPPEPNELGWKETFRMNPLESIIFAMRPTMPPNLPFEVPNSVRYLDPTVPDAAVLDAPPGGFVDPLLNAVTVTNHKVNFGWEYVWHCHILSHEEMDMMHPLCFAVAPKAPTDMGYTLLGGNKGIRLNWTDNAINETGFLVERAKAAAGPWTTLATVPEAVGKGTALTFTDASFRTNQLPYYYRVTAVNVVGDTTVYSGTGPNFPVVTASSTPVQVGPPLGTVTLTSVTQALASKAPVVVNWSWVAAAGDTLTGFTVQRATDAGFTKGLANFAVAASARSYNDTSTKGNVTYYYRVMANSALGSGTPSNYLSILAHA